MMTTAQLHSARPAAAATWKSTCALLLLSLVSLTVHAQSLSADEARDRALQFLDSIRNTPTHFHGMDVPPRRQKGHDLHLCYASETLYSFDTSDGFLLCPATTLLPALLGYSDGSSFEAACTNAGFRYLIEQFEQGILRLTAQSNPGHIYKPASVKENVPPLLSDQWHQMAPYNRLCPVTDGDTCVTGCVANSMAQTMRFWQYPRQGTGFHTYTDSTGCGQTLTADFASHTYDWSNMLDNYDQADYSDRQVMAVAQLLSDCGIAVDMRYTPTASGAQPIYQCTALVNYFGYDPGLQLYYHNFFPQQEWDSLMFTELSAGRPIIVNAWSPTLGHSFSCDGYDTDGYFHIRFGNPEGDADGYYYFTWLTPDQPLWYDKDNPERGLNLLQSITIGIQPPAATTVSPQRYFFGFSHIDALGNDQVAIYHLGNIGWNVHTGRVALALKASDAPAVTDTASTTLLYTYSRTFALEEIDDTTYSDTLSLRLPTSLADGIYRICPVYEQDGQFFEARTMVGTPNFLRCQVDHGQAVLSTATEAQAQLSISDVIFPDSVELNLAPSFSIRVTNNGAEYSGRLYFALVPSPQADTRLNIFNEEGLSLEPGETACRTFARTPLRNVRQGTYFLRIMADCNLFTDSLSILYQDSSHAVTVLPAGYTAIQYPTSDTAAPLSVFDLQGRPVSDWPSAPRGIYLIQEKTGFRKVLKESK